MRPLEGKTVQYCVIFDGSVAAVAANKALASDAGAGEDYVVATAIEAAADPKDFLIGSALVYAFQI